MLVKSGLEYYHKLNTTIEECVEKARTSPFETFVFITDHKDYIEKLFFKHTQYLVNIEIMTWKQFLQTLKNHYQLYSYHEASQLEITYVLRHILKTHSFSCFNNSQPYPLIHEFIPLIKDYDLYDINYNIKDFSKEKMKDFISLYQYTQELLNGYLSIENIFQDNSFDNLPYHHIYIEADHLYQTKRQNIIQKLSQVCDVTCLYTYTNDKRLMNMPYHRFCQQAIEYPKTSPLSSSLFQQVTSQIETDQYFYFISSSLHQEVKRVVYTIAQKIVDENLRYKDFTIVYPDQKYIDLLIHSFQQAKIPHDLAITTMCQYDYSYQKIMRYNHDGIFPLCQIAKMLKKEQLDKDYIDYLNLLNEYQDEMTIEEFKEFFQATYQNNHQEKRQTEDLVHVCTIDQLRLSSKQHVFILGCNETILPKLIKDTSLLLDEDIEELRDHSFNSPLTTLELLGVHHNDILKALLQPFASLTISYSQQTLSGETLLPSSLFKDLMNMYTFIELEPLRYLPIDDYYLNHGKDKTRVILNQNISDYLSTKNQPVLLSQDTVQQLYSPTLSVSQIETYNKCPFLYFIQYGLGIYPLKEEKLLPNELGSLIHYVLSICIDQDKDISSLVQEYIQKDENLYHKIQQSYVNQYFIEQLEKDLHITLNVLHKHYQISSFDILSKEQKVQEDIHGMKFKGFVDRIDQYNNYISIIDYKSSAKDIDLNLAMQGFNIQMLIYLKMVTKQYQKDPGAVLYFNTKKRILSVDQSLKDPIPSQEFYKQYRYGGYIIDDESHGVINAIDPYMDKRSDIINVTYVKSRNEYKGHLLTKEQLDHLFEKIEEHIYTLYQEMCQGHIDILPKGSDQNATHTMVNPCHYCAYRSICNFDIFYNEYKMVEFLDIDAILGGEKDAV